MTCTQKILLIDDDADFVKALARRFAHYWDVRILTAHNALTALMKLQEVPDLVICDVKMPTGNGLSILEMMSRDTHLNHVPVVVLTGCSDGTTLQRVANLSAHFVYKGSDVCNKLRAVVEELLDVTCNAETPSRICDAFNHRHQC